MANPRLSLLFLFVAAIMVIETPFGADAHGRRYGGYRDNFNRGDRSRDRSSEDRDDDDDNNGVSPAVIRSMLARLSALNSRVRELENRGCDSGSVDVVVCDDNDDTTLTFTPCTVSQVFSGDNTTVIVPVNFTADFQDIPTVVAGLSGASFIAGKDCKVEVEDVSLTGFNIKVILEGILPFELRLFWIACSQASTMP